MQQLEARRFVHVHKVHVEVKKDVGVGNVFRLGHRPDVPCRSVKRVAQGSDARRDLFNLVARVGNVADKDQAEFREMLHGHGKLGAVVHVVVVRDPVLQLLHLRAIPQVPLPSLARVIHRVYHWVLQEFGIVRGHVRRVVPFNVIFPLYLQLLPIPLDVGRSDGERNVTRPEIALFGMLVHALRAFARVSQLREVK